MSLRLPQDTPTRLSLPTVIGHWLVGAAFLAVLVVGFVMKELDPGPTKWMLYGNHKAMGTIVFVLATARIWWRWRNGWPTALGGDVVWRQRAARGAHWVLIGATLAMPVSGMVMTAAGGHVIPLFGLVDLGPWFKVSWLAGGAHWFHDIAGKVVAAIVLVHIVVALWHHFGLKDATLRRMVGQSVDKS